MSEATETTTVKQAGDRLRRAAKKADGAPVRAPQMEPGQMFCQGDIGILRIAELPKGARKIDRPKDGQVAPGTSRGSRHCVVGEGAFYRFPGDALSDLCFESATEWTMTHPEHAHVTCEPGLYQMVHQQNEQRQRVVD